MTETREEDRQERALAGYRVVDLTTEDGWLCGKVLAALGADVIKIEPPGGDPGRQRGPFYLDEMAVDTSLCWWAYNTNKRSLCVDLACPPGRDLCLALIHQADFVIESFPPGQLEALELGYRALHAGNPRLILTSITPFGQSGPYRDFQGSDIVCMAMGGLMHLSGETRGRPVRISLPQAALHAGVEAAVASLLAHHWRQRSGVGQHIDVSMQACVAWTLMAASGFVPCKVPPPSRSGPFYTWVGYPRRLNFPCQDGYVSMFLVGGFVGARSMTALTQLMHAEGMAPPFMLDKDWFNWKVSGLGQAGRVESDRIDAAVAAYTRDLAQSEASGHFLAPALLDYTVNGRIMRRQGNRDPHMAPHGVYPCQGEDRWCVIAVATDAQWQHLCDVAGHPEWRHDPRFATGAGRVHYAETLDALLIEWTRTQPPYDLMTRLQAAGVTAGVAQDMHDLRQDPQLQQRGFWVELDHGEIGPVAVDGHQFRFSTLVNQPRFARPGLGEHNAYVLGDILGLTAEEIRRLVEAEIVY